MQEPAVINDSQMNQAIGVLNEQKNLCKIAVTDLLCEFSNVYRTLNICINSSNVDDFLSHSKLYFHLIDLRTGDLMICTNYKNAYHFGYDDGARFLVPQCDKTASTPFHHTAMLQMKNILVSDDTIYNELTEAVQQYQREKQNTYEYIQFKVYQAVTKPPS